MEHIPDTWNRRHEEKTACKKSADLKSKRSKEPCGFLSFTGMQLQVEGQWMFSKKTEFLKNIKMLLLFLSLFLTLWVCRHQGQMFLVLWINLIFFEIGLIQSTRHMFLPPGII